MSCLAGGKIHWQTRRGRANQVTAVMMSETLLRPGRRPGRCRLPGPVTTVRFS